MGQKLKQLNHLVNNYSSSILPSLGRVELWHLYTVGIIDNNTMNKYIKGKRS